MIQVRARLGLVKALQEIMPVMALRVSIALSRVLRQLEEDGNISAIRRPYDRRLQARRA